MVRQKQSESDKTILCTEIEVNNLKVTLLPQFPNQEKELLALILWQGYSSNHVG